MDPDTLQTGDYGWLAAEYQRHRACVMDECDLPEEAAPDGIKVKGRSRTRKTARTVHARRILIWILRENYGQRGVGAMREYYRKPQGVDWSHYKGYWQPLATTVIGRLMSLNHSTVWHLLHAKDAIGA